MVRKVDSGIFVVSRKLPKKIKKDRIFAQIILDNIDFNNIMGRQKRKLCEEYIQFSFSSVNLNICSCTEFYG